MMDIQSKTQDSHTQVQSHLQSQNKKQDLLEPTMIDSTNQTTGAAAARPKKNRQGYDIKKHAVEARALSRRNKRAVLYRLWHWRLIDWRILGDMMGVSRSTSYRILEGLHDDGLIQKMPTSGMVIKPYILTTDGADAIMPYLEIDELEVSPATKLTDIRVDTITHDLLVQRFVLMIENHWPLLQDLRENIIQFLESKAENLYDDSRASVKQIAAQAREGTRVSTELMQPLSYSAAYLEATQWNFCGKIPDALISLIVHGNLTIHIAIECQQTPEKIPTVKRILSGYCQELADNDPGKFRLDFLVYCGTRPNVLTPYTRYLDKDLRPWRKTDARRWRELTDAQTPFQNWMVDRVLALEAKHFESEYYALRLS